MSDKCESCEHEGSPANTEPCFLCIENEYSPTREGETGDNYQRKEVDGG